MLVLDCESSGSVHNITIVFRYDATFLIHFQITFADLAFHYCLFLPEAVFGIDTPWNSFPKLKVLWDKIGNHPNIKAWMGNRPQNVM